MKARAGSLVACLMVMAAMMAPDARGADYPTHSIKLVVNYAAGGPTDLLARLFGDFLSKDLKQPLIIENKGGAQGAIGAEEVARSEPDGYTLLFTTGSVIVTNPLLYKKLSYDPDRDFKMLAIICELAAGDGGASVGAGDDSRGAGRLRQTKPRQGQFWIGRCRRHGAFGGRNVQAGRRNPDDPRSL